MDKKAKKTPKSKNAKAKPCEIDAEIQGPPKVTKIRVEYDDGSAKEAIGDDANKIMEHWNAAEFMLYNHGQTYGGPCLEEVAPLGLKPLITPPPTD